MKKHNQRLQHSSGGMLVGFALVEVSMILILIAQSFPSIYRAIIFWGGVTLLITGLLLLIGFITFRRPSD